MGLSFRMYTYKYLKEINRIFEVILGEICLKYYIDTFEKNFMEIQKPTQKIRFIS